MRNLFLYVPAFIVSTITNAATPAEIPSFEPYPSKLSKSEIIAASMRCSKSLLKNEGFVGESIPSVFGFKSKDAAAKNTTVDPSVIIDNDTEAGHIEMRHIFAVSGFATAGIIRADLSFDAKDNKYRMNWHDVVYALDAPNWQNKLQPLIKQALPHNKAVLALSQTAQKLAECIDQPAQNSNW